MNLAVAFGYLERLLYIGDSGKFYEEEARLRSLSNVLNQAGFEPYLYEDFADELFGLIRSIANAINEGNGEEVLMNAFNDESIQNYVITHFKVRIDIAAHQRLMIVLTRCIRLSPPHG